MATVPVTPSSSAYTAGQLTDQAAALLNDPAKTDYTFAVLKPFLVMAYYELVDYQLDGQHPPLVSTSESILVPAGSSQLNQANAATGPYYPWDLHEVQQMGERRAGTTDLFVPMKRTEFLGYLGEPQDRLRFWTWEYETIIFPRGGATVDIEVQIKFLRGLISANGIWITEESIVAGHNTHTFLIYKTAALASQFIGENAERAAILDHKAETALERMESVNNKGRQQIMTRHKPFRAAWKMRGGF